MVRTKKADPVEVTHNVESCVCSDCKIHKLELEVNDLKARYADERAHYEARLYEVVMRSTETEARNRESLSRRIKLLEGRATDLENARLSKVVGDNTFETKVTQRLRDLEACKPIEIRDRDVAHISRDLNLVRERLERIVTRLNPPV